MILLFKALVLVEDRRFFKHFGVDPMAIVRAFLTNLREGRRAQGGSTITQQLARTLYLHNRKTILRKILEMLVAFYLELRYSKKEILELYIKSVYMGQRTKAREIRGFYEASLFYFDKPLEETTFSEKAALIAMVKGPNTYGPSSNKGIARRIMVLSKMLDSGMMSQEEFFRASREKL